MKWKQKQNNIIMLIRSSFRNYINCLVLTMCLLVGYMIILFHETPTHPTHNPPHSHRLDRWKMGQMESSNKSSSISYLFQSFFL